MVIMTAIILLPSCEKEETLTQKDSEEKLALAQDGPEPCYRCQDLIIGTYFFDGTEIWIPNEAGNPLQPGNPNLSIEMDWSHDELVFRSEVKRFCAKPPKVWTYSDFNLQDLLLYECEPATLEVSISEGGHEMILAVDDSFLQCAFESEMAGFKFAIPTF